MDALLNLFFDHPGYLRRRRGPVGRREFQSLILRRIVAGRHIDPANRLPHPNGVRDDGRRRIPFSTGEIERLVAYQIGAAQALAAYAGTKIAYVKCHGALGNLCEVERFLWANDHCVGLRLPDVTFPGAHRVTAFRVSPCRPEHTTTIVTSTTVAVCLQSRP